MIEQTPQEVLAELTRQINDRINAAMEASLKRQAKFDEDTSLFYSPEWQQWWSSSVNEVAIRKILKHSEIRNIKPKPPLRKVSASWVTGPAVLDKKMGRVVSDPYVVPIKTLHFHSAG